MRTPTASEPKTQQNFVVSGTPKSDRGPWVNRVACERTLTVITSRPSVAMDAAAPESRISATPVTSANTAAATPPTSSAGTIAELMSASTAGRSGRR